VALARALAIEPRVLLLDEPFGALDARVRKDLRRWMRELHRRTGYTTVFVTHDQEEALELADRIVVMNAGRIEQVGPTVEVYEQPATPFVFEFLGDANVLTEEDLRCAALRAEQRVYVRPHDFAFAPASAPGIDAIVSGTQRTGPTIRVAAQRVGGDAMLDLEFAHLDVRASRLVAGDRIRVAPQRFALFPK
jgi:sulfate transport system ATP-binding protein